MGRKISLEEIDVRKYPAVHVVLPGFLRHYGWDDALQKLAISYPYDRGIRYVFIDADADEANEIIRNRLEMEIRVLQDKGQRVIIEVLDGWLVNISVASENEEDGVRVRDDASSEPPRLGEGKGQEG